MEKELLHKMFEGNATDAELTKIREWVEASLQNKKIFFAERKLYDALLFNEVKTKPATHKTHLFFRRWSSVVAAAIAFFFLLYTVPYFLKENTREAIAMNTVTVPAGQRVELKLADGTHVWLNALSELSYPVSFNGEKREVRLKGEAFFDVAKNKSKKFIVHAGRCEVEVLGTQFNVEAYKENEFSTALLRGSVKVTDKSQPEQSVVLAPNNTVSLTNGRLTVSPITDFNPYSWKDGLITFKDISFKALMEKLEKNYGIHICIENRNLDHYACSGKFRISDGIEEVLRAIQQDARFSFEREDAQTIRIR